VNYNFCSYSSGTNLSLNLFELITNLLINFYPCSLYTWPKTYIYTNFKDKYLHWYILSRTSNDHFVGQAL